MSEKFKQRFGILVKSVMPAVAVMVTGLIATYILYGNHPRAQAEGAQFSANAVSGVEPAAGTPAAAPAEAKVAPAPTDEKAMPPDAGTGTTIMKDEGEDSGETGSSTDNTMSSGATPDTGTTGGEPAPAPAPAPSPAQ
ncbi:MAG TPA: hypothetical protein VL625_01925 [Patescibacteria group bacterium]|nr:hypothetical protein [Patescibacteria group bacterium]